MEEELKCPCCRRLLHDPILLHCAHSYCRACAVSRQVKASSLNQAKSKHPSPPFSARQATKKASRSSGASSSSFDSASIKSHASLEEHSYQPSAVSDALLAAEKLSVDSGVCAAAAPNAASTRPSSFLCPSPASSSSFSSTNSASAAGTGSTALSWKIPSILSTPANTSGYALVCERCHRPSYFPDSEHLKSVPTNYAVQRVLSRFSATSTPTTDPPISAKEPAIPKCQWCVEGDEASPSGGTSKPAACYCDSCGFYYCLACQPVIHPPRGPLKDHKLVSVGLPINGPLPPSTLNMARSNGERPMVEPMAGKALKTTCEPCHPDEPLTMYCMVCRQAVCCECVKETSRHQGHSVQSLSTAVKQQKSLQLLSEKAKTATEEIGQMKAVQERIQTNCSELKAQLNAEFDALQRQLEARRAHLLSIADQQMDAKRAHLREQITHCSGHMTRTRALIAFSIELLKEPEPVAYLQVGNAMANRVTQEELAWSREMRTQVEPGLSEFRLTLDTRELQKAIDTVEFSQLKVPPRPQFSPSECQVENNSISLSWQCPTSYEAIPIDGYQLELAQSPSPSSSSSATLPQSSATFKQVYSGREPCCTVEGLQFNSAYSVRVRAYNGVGQSAYSGVLSLRTAHVAWFELEPTTSKNHELALSNHNCTLTSTSIDYRSIKGEPGFHSGVHYWEVQIDRFDSTGVADIVVGVAQQSMNEAEMLGKDLHGWSMYIDGERSWFLHNGVHHGRRPLAVGEMRAGSVIGVKMDCDRGTLTFYINDKRVAAGGDEGYAFKSMPRGLYYPAFSVNRNAAITVHPGLTPPPSPNHLPMLEAGITEIKL